MTAILIDGRFWIFGVVTILIALVWLMHIVTKKQLLAMTPDELFEYSRKHLGRRYTDRLLESNQLGKRHDDVIIKDDS